MICPECSKEMKEYKENLFECMFCGTHAHQLAIDDYDLTEDHYEIARKNGIERNIVQIRVYNHLWNIHDAITKPLGAHRLFTDEQLIIMRERDLKYTTIYNRIVNMGLTYEEAINVNGNLTRKDKVFTDEQLEIAKENGIPRKLAYERVKKCGWSKEKAISRPKMSKSEISENMKKRVAKYFEKGLI